MDEPSKDNRADKACDMTHACVSAVAHGSLAFERGLRAGDAIVEINGKSVRDILDWQWESAEDEIDLRYLDSHHKIHDVYLSRENYEDWGIELEGAVFDRIMTCKNNCSFCFMRQLPRGLRNTLFLRDDDFRMSFLDGTFITLTNLDDTHIARIIEQHISPLRVSLHAIDPAVRKELIGKHAERGFKNLITLLEAGIEFDAQIVLVPDINDGAVLDETLTWAYAHEGIKAVSIVPLGFTRFQTTFDHSFDDPVSAARVLDQLRPFQQRALDERGEAWVYAADEFYRNAYQNDLLDVLPPACFYGDFSMYEDGIGIIRSAVDDFEEAQTSGLMAQCARALKEAHLCVRYLCGYAMEPYFGQLLRASELKGIFEPLPVANEFFGGNVNVTGLLAGRDIVRAIETSASKDSGACLYAIPQIIFNADGVTLDDMSLDDIKTSLAPCVADRVCVVAGNPLDYIEQLQDIARTNHTDDEL